MKPFIKLILILTCLQLTACEKEGWSNGDPAMEHVYYFGFEQWGYDETKKGNNNVLNFNVEQGQTVEIKMQFWCEFVRSYDVETYYYVTDELKRGTDFEVVDANGQVLQPDADGAFKLVWPNAKKGVQSVYIKALNGAKGSFNLQTFNPNSTVELSNQDVTSTIQNKTDNYEVRVFTQNYKAKINVN